MPGDARHGNLLFENGHLRPQWARAMSKERASRRADGEGARKVRRKCANLFGSWATRDPP